MTSHRKRFAFALLTVLATTAAHTQQPTGPQPTLPNAGVFQPLDAAAATDTPTAPVTGTQPLPKDEGLMADQLPQVYTQRIDSRISAPGSSPTAATSTAAAAATAGDTGTVSTGVAATPAEGPAAPATPAWAQVPTLELVQERPAAEDTEETGAEAAQAPPLEATSEAIASPATDMIPDEERNRYLIDAGDRIQIYVHGQPDLSVQAVVSYDGYILYPLVGELEVWKQTPQHLEQRLTEMLAGDYLVNPKVSIIMLQYGGFYLRGAVNRPGKYPFRPDLNIRKALLEADGMTALGSDSKIYVIHDNEDEKVKVDLDYIIQAGDIIEIGESWF